MQEYNDPKNRTDALAQIDEDVAQIDRLAPIRYDEEGLPQDSFWASDDPDEFAMVEDGDDDFYDDEITSMAHAEVELHREMREYARIAAWDMPLLSSKSHLPHPFLLFQPLTVS